jgi:hypothetical protein
MPDFKFQRDTQRFFSLGMDLNRPIDEVKQLKYTLLKNVRSYQTGRMEPRQGLTLIGTVTGPVHSIRRLNVPRTSDYTRVIGSGTVLSTGKTSFTQRDTGWSGAPLAMVPYRPSQSPDPWMYVMDSIKHRKVNVSGTIHQVGMPPPTTAPVVVRSAVQHVKPILAASASFTGWSGGPGFVAVGPQTPAALLANAGVTYTDIATTILEILYDTGNTGWCTIQPGVITGITNNMRLLVANTEEVTVQDLSTGSASASAIQSITLIPTGLYAIVLTTIQHGTTVGGMIENVTRSSKAQIKAVISGPTDVQTLLCDADPTWTAGDVINVLSAFRCYTSTTRADGDSLVNKRLNTQTNITNDLALPLTGYVCSPKFTPPLDLSQITSSISTTPDSYIAINLSVSHPKDTTLIKLMFGCTNASTDHDKFFETDFFYVEFTPDQLDSSNGLKIKLASFLEVGNPSWKNVYYMQIETTIRDPIDANERLDYKNIITVTFFHSVFLGGEPGPDTGTLGQPYIYRYRARCSTTGVVSNWSPATLLSYDLVGESVSLSIPAQYTLATEADRIDFQRRGGSIPDNWYYVGSVNNDASPATFIDKYADDVIIVNPSEGQVHFQLWPIIGAPVTGTGASISGVMLTGTGFSTAWAPNTPILIAGTWYTIYQVYSTTSLQVYESGGTQSNVTWEVPEPILQSQPMPCFWGPLAETFFGCGDPVNPQRLYWTNVGDADSTQQNNWRDITTPSEPLMNGLVYNGRSYVWSSERFFQVIPDGQDAAGNIISWNYVEIPSGKGLWARWAFTNPQSMPGDVIYFLGKDGIYATDGGTPSDSTAEDLRPLFPNEGNLGETINTVPFPYMVTGAAQHFRLSYYDDYMYFDYPDNTLAISISVSLSDALSAMGDSIASPHLQAALEDQLLSMSDTGGLTLLFPGSAFSDSLNNLSDTLGVTVT